MNRLLFSSVQVLEFTCIIHGGVNYDFKEALNIIYLANVHIAGVADRGERLEERKKEMVVNSDWNKK